MPGRLQPSHPYCMHLLVRSVISTQSPFLGSDAAHRPSF